MIKKGTFMTPRKKKILNTGSAKARKREWKLLSF
jgi:hypothetical protein